MRIHRKNSFCRFCCLSGFCCYDRSYCFGLPFSHSLIQSFSHSPPLQFSTSQYPLMSFCEAGPEMTELSFPAGMPSDLL